MPFMAGFLSDYSHRCSEISFLAAVIIYIDAFLEHERNKKHKL